MKDYIKNQYFIISSLVISLGFIILNLLFLELPIFVNYIAFAILGIAISLEIVYISLYHENKRMRFLESRMKLWNTISYRVKKAGEISFNEMPIGIVVFNNSLDIDWANNYAKEIFLSPLIERNLKNLDKQISDKIIDAEKEFNVTLYGKTYECILLTEENVIYLTDITEKTAVSARYLKRMLAIGVLNLDNLETAIGTLDARERSIQISNLIGILTEWAEKLNIAIKGYADERYLLIMDHQTIDMIIKSNFDILDQVKQYCIKENLRVTASIGIASSDGDALSLMDIAYKQLDLALSRGGNQAVVSINDEISYFGAKTESFEARTSISIRVKTEELSDLIIDSSKVYIMAHKYIDADAFGAAIGMRNFCRALDREAQIIFDESLIDETVTNVFETIKKEHIIFLNAFIHPKEALTEMTESTLLIIVDCQYQSLLLDDKVFKKAKKDKIAIIDHHRRNNNAIDHQKFLYAYPSASSSVELIVEMIEYLEKKVEISEIEATWMLMGVAVDTNNFLYRTTNRTFQVLAKLQSYGADMVKVQRYLREKFNDYVKKTSILYNMEIVDGIYGVTLCDDDIYQRAFLAKIADSMIGVKDIKIAFCIGKIGDDTIGISARSLDEANVQVIMERLGGGGHFNNAATQLKGVSIEDAKELLVKTLRENKEGENSKFMKIILTKDVKAKGKKDDIIDIPAGHANFLIRSKQAIEATPDNIKHLEYQRMTDKKMQDKHLLEMNQLKEKVEDSPIKVFVKVGKSGKLFGSVSSKQIVDEFKSEYNIELDKRKILHDDDINALGTYKIAIQLHKEVTAIMTIHVVEKE